MFGEISHVVSGSAVVEPGLLHSACLSYFNKERVINHQNPDISLLMPHQLEELCQQHCSTNMNACTVASQCPAWVYESDLLPNFVKELKPRAFVMSARVILQYSHPASPCKGERKERENIAIRQAPLQLSDMMKHSCSTFIVEKAGESLR